MRTRSKRSAAALRHDGVGAPRIVAAGRGRTAERIAEAAAEAGVPVREDPLLADALAALQLGSEVPPELYRAVAEALVWAYRLGSTPLPSPRGLTPERRRN